MENDTNYNALNMNGTLKCKGATCKLKCLKGYDFWKRGPRKSSCKSKTDPTKNGAGWNRSLSACQTCKNIPGKVPNEIVDFWKFLGKYHDFGNQTSFEPKSETPEGMTKKCKILKSGLKQCMYRCLNKQKIKTINRKNGFVVCKCWPNDTDNMCHWRLFGNNMAVDKAGFHMKR